MSDLTEIVETTTRRLIEDTLDTALRRQIEAGGDGEALRVALEGAGLFDALSAGLETGPFAGLQEAVAVSRAAGAAAAAAPLAEMLVARWIAAATGLAVGSDPVAVLPGSPGAQFVARGQGAKLRVSGSDPRLPWLPTSGRALVLAEGAEGPVAALVEVPAAMREDRLSVASEPLAAVRLDECRALAAAAPGGVAAEAVCARAPAMLALLRAAMMVGAAEQTVAISVRYAGERKQFGRPIGKFQAVQQNLALLAGETAASAAVLDAAVFEILRRGDWSALADAASARIRLMAAEIARIAHQVHGAIGFTQEYPLHDLTRRLLAWRDDYGTGRDWSVRLARPALGVEWSGLWPLVTAT
jgi:alkylation response protein AidB-like acyl-CoA dehydrogenase